MSDGLRVLVVDDVEACRSVLSNALGALSSVQIVGTASSGQDALAKLDSLRPDMVLLDVEMPDMDGIELLQELRNYSHLGKTRIYALTGFSENTTQARQVGFDGHFIKPVDIDALLQEIVEPRHG